jgi:hypothetical protein
MAGTKPGGSKGPPPAEVPVQTGGGGEGDDDGQSVSQLAAQMAAKNVAASGSRKALVTDADFQLVPETLVGSWFHRLENGEMIWQGVVVAEPQAGVYLVQIDHQEPGARNTQRLIPLMAMINDDDGYDWRFYDTENEARSAYAEWLTTTERIE